MQNLSDFKMDMINLLISHITYSNKQVLYLHHDLHTFFNLFYEWLSTRKFKLLRQPRTLKLNYIYYISYMKTLFYLYNWTPTFVIFCNLCMCVNKQKVKSQSCRVWYWSLEETRPHLANHAAVLNIFKCVYAQSRGDTCLKT